MDESLQLQDLKVKVDTLYARVYARWNQIKERLARLERSITAISEFFESSGIVYNLFDIQTGEVSYFPSLCLNFPMTYLMKFPNETNYMVKYNKQQE